MAQPTDQSDRRQAEIGRRQSLFREVNERIDEIAEGLDLQEEMSIFCECGSDRCQAQLTLTAAEYERLRRFPTRFAVRAGHEIAVVERVVETNERYVIVEKFGEAAITAIKLDPRRPS